MENDIHDIKFKTYYFGNKTRESKISIIDSGILFNIDDKLK